MVILSVEELKEGILRIELGLGNMPLGSVNAYLVLSGENPLLIDPGPYEEETADLLLSALKQVGADVEKLDVFVTHFHIDHIGQAYALHKRSAQVLFNPTEAKLLLDDLEQRWDFLKKVMLSHGFTKSEIEEMEDLHPIRFIPKIPLAFVPVEDGQVLKRGNLSFSVVSTPGHSPGHSCLYEPNLKFFIAGDHVLETITPNVGFWPEIEDPLGAYLKSLLKVRNLEVDLTLPGHGRPFSNLKKRVDELLSHHQRRCEEILEALNEPKTAYEVASLIHWDIGGNWSEFTVHQKWFALSETISHLHYLVKRGKVRKDFKGNVWVFYRSP